MPVITPTAHLWQVGLGEAGERVCTTLVVPVEADLGAVTSILDSEWDGLACVPATGYCHLTLAAIEGEADWEMSRVVEKRRWLITGVEATAWSLRAVVDCEMGDICEAFGVEIHPAYITLAYAVEPVALAGLAEVGKRVGELGLSGELGVVERRRFDGQCRVFSPVRLHQWTLGEDGSWDARTPDE